MPEIVPNPINREQSLNTQIHSSVRMCMDTSLPPEQRGKAWGEALKTVARKESIDRRVRQALHPAHFNEPIVDKSFIDDRILEGFSPLLKKEVIEGRAHPLASLAIVEQTLRGGAVQLQKDQAVSFASKFPPQYPGESFAAYKARVEPLLLTEAIPGKSPSDMWSITRRTMDVLEIADELTRRLSFQFGKTIYMSDLVKASIDALDIVHQLATEEGVRQVSKADISLLENSHEALEYQDVTKNTILQVLKHPTLLLSSLFDSNPRIVASDANELFKFPPIAVEGAEHVPPTGRLIVAFSHMDRWRDKNVPPNWEKILMLQTLQQKRQVREMYLLAYLSYFRESAPPGLRALVGKKIEVVTDKLKKHYGINILDVNPKALKETMQRSEDALLNEKVVLLSPEGLPAPEVLKPKRGIAGLARETHAPVISVAFREDQEPDGSFTHSVHFSPLMFYNAELLPGNTTKQKDEAFADSVMRSIAVNVPHHQRGIYRTVSAA